MMLKIFEDKNNYIPTLEREKQATDYAFSLMDKLDSEEFWGRCESKRDEILSIIKWAYIDAYQEGVRATEFPF